MISAGLAAVAAGLGWKMYSDHSGEILAEDLSGVFRTHHSYAVSVGQSYLACTPQEADHQVLSSLLLSDGAAEFSKKPAALRAYIRDRIRQDFAEGRITEVDGWVLSITEARLCAITTVPVKKKNAA
jgi:hypothetical protein